jgi:hypothetical protein
MMQHTIVTEVKLIGTRVMDINLTSSRLEVVGYWNEQHKYSD